MFHVHGLVIGILGPLRRGAHVEHAGRFSPQALADALRRGATMVFGVPTMYSRIAKEAETDQDLARAFAKARLLVSGSAALPMTVHEAMKRLTGQQILERYGLTETLMNTGTRLGDPVIPGRVGPPLPDSRSSSSPRTAPRSKPATTRRSGRSPSAAPTCSRAT